MWEFLRDSMWQLVAVLLALVAVFVPILVYLKQRTRKSLSYEILSLNPLLSVENEIKGDVQILYQSKTVEQVHLIVLKIINTGNMPILSTDYERPISLSFGEESKILTTEITGKNPDSLRPSARIEEGMIVLAPILLNVRDSVTLKMLVNKFGKVTVDGRIAGVREIKETEKKVLRYYILAVGGITIQIVGFFLPSIPSILFVILGGILGIFGLTRLPRK